MKIHAPLFLAISGLIFSQAAPSMATIAVTVPVGVLTVDVRPGNATTPPTQSLGFGLSTPSDFQSLVASVSTVSSLGGNVTQLNFAANVFTPSVLGGSGGAGTHFVEIVGGSSGGLISHVSGSSSGAIVLQDLLGSITGSFSVRVRPFLTVAGAFGTTNSAGFLGSSSPGSADIIRILLPGVSPVEVYYNTTAGAWQTTAGASANTQPIYPDGGVEVVRRSTLASSFRVVGEVKTGPTAVIVEGGAGDVISNFQNLYPLASVRLKDLGLYTGNATTGVKEGTTVANSDVLTIEDRTTGVKNQFFLDSISKRWKTGFTDASLIQIPQNSSVSLTRRNGQPFTWTVPQPSMNIGAEPLPLTLVAAASRKTHGTSGTWDVNLPFGGSSVGIEPRTGGGSGNHTVVFTFDGASASNPLTSGQVAISSGVGSIVNTQFIGNELIVNLTGVSNQQTIALVLSNITAQNGLAVLSAQSSVGFLFGDINYNRIVNVADIAQAKASSGFFGLGSFRTDVNVNGMVNVADIAQTKVNSTASLP